MLCYWLHHTVYLNVRCWRTIHRWGRMAQIEIGTSQNVDIQYEAANIMERIVANIIDAAIMFGVLFGMYLLVIALVLSEADERISAIIGWVFLGLAILDVLYPLLCETFLNGQTVGKKVMRLRVMRVDGTQPRIVDYFLRWLIGLGEIAMTSGSVAAVAIIASKHNQRLGDMAAGTTVVRLPKNTTLSAALLKVDDVPTKPVVFEQVRRLTDKDIAIIREVFTTAASNAISQQAATELLWRTKARVEEVLGVTAEGRPEDFLSQVMEDYNTIYGNQA